MNERNEQTDETITELTMPPPTSGNNSTTLTTTTGATDWRDSYLESLHESERNDPVNRDLVAACSALADRVAALEAEKAVLQQQQQQQSDSQAQAQPTTPTPTTKPPTAGPPTTTTTATANDPATPPIDTAQARLDLAEALRSRGQLETRLRGAEEEVRRLRARAKTDERRVRDLVAERTALAARLKDRSEELVEKNRMVTVCPPSPLYPFPRPFPRRI